MIWNSGTVYFEKNMNVLIWVPSIWIRICIFDDSAIWMEKRIERKTIITLSKGILLGEIGNCIDSHMTLNRNVYIWWYVNLIAKKDLEENKAPVHRKVYHTKSSKQFRIVHKNRHQKKHKTAGYYWENNTFLNVLLFIVAYFMSNDSEDFLCRLFFYKSIK